MAGCLQIVVDKVHLRQEIEAWRPSGESRATEGTAANQRAVTTTGGEIRQRSAAVTVAMHIYDPKTIAVMDRAFAAIWKQGKGG